MTTDEIIEQKVQDALSLLAEHFDSLQFLGTRLDNGVSQMYALGVGCWYARQGMAHEFINKSIAEDQAFALGEVLDGEI